MNQFHFLRPYWLLALLPALILVWRLWSASDDRRPWRGIISHELLPHLLVGEGQHRPLHPVQLLCLGWILTAVALAGPAWKREPAPFAEETTAVVLVLKVTPSMMMEDVPPSRLARLTQKIRDLLKLRPGTRTALVAYSGSAHRVLPLTTDGEIINAFTTELRPDLFPKEGDAAGQALKLASTLIEKSGERGWILWMADSVSEDQLKELKKVEPELAPVSLLVPEIHGSEFDSIRRASEVIRADLVPLTPDDTDIQHLLRRTRFSGSKQGNPATRWQDSGYWITPFTALLILFWFRRGWVIRGSAWGGA